MRKKILIPTDFSTESLMLLKRAAENNAGNRLDILLCYCVYLPDSITELLFYSSQQKIRSVMSAEFSEACDMLRNKYQSVIHTISYDTFHGITHAAFTNYITAKKISEIYVPLKYKFLTRGDAFNPMPYMLKSGLPLVKADWEDKSGTPGKQLLTGLFSD